MSHLVRTDTVASKVIAALGLQMTPSQLLANLSVATQPDTLPFKVYYDDTDPGQGIRILDEVGRAFAPIADGVLSGQAETSANVVHPRVAVGSAGSVGKIEPKPVRNVAIAGLLGLLLGVVAAFVREQFDDTVRGVGDVEEAFGKEATATLPPRLVGYRPLGASRNRMDPVLAELAIQRLAGNLVWAPKARGCRTLLITSAQPEEGKSTVTANLAVELASSGHRVIVVEADLRRPTLHAYLGLEASAGAIGLDAVMRRRATVTAALIDIPVWSRSDPAAGDRSSAGEASRDARGHLRVILSSPGHTWPAETGSERVLEVLNALKSRADYVIFDAPPSLVVPDAYPLISAVDVVIAVVRSGKSSAGATAAMARLLERLQARQVELVVTEAQATFEHTYYGTYTPRPRRARRFGPATVAPEPSSAPSFAQELQESTVLADDSTVADRSTGAAAEASDEAPVVPAGGENGKRRGRTAQHVDGEDRAGTPDDPWSELWGQGD